MCGLVGTAGNLLYKDEALMRRLLILDYFRGTDSTGLASVRMDGEIKIAKMAVNPIDLFDSTKFKAVLNGNMSKVFIGHNRAATRGVINNNNAHPFEYDHIVGAHNGTLDLNCVKELEEELGEKFDVDSMAIFAGIAKLGLKKTISMLSGAWAIVYYDNKEKTLNMIRNKERPLWYSYSDDFKQLFWASEWPMIRAAVDLGDGYKLYTDDKGHRFWQLSEDTHYSWNVNSLMSGSTDVPKPTVKKMEGKPPPKKEVGAYQNPFHPGTNVVKMHSTTTSGASSTRSNKADTELDIYNVLGDLNEPFGGLISRERFEELARFGCSWCSCDIEWGDVGITIYDKDDAILCADHSPHSKHEKNRVYTDTVNELITIQ